MIKKNYLWRLLLCQLLLMLSASFNLISAQTGPNDDFDGDGIINAIDIDDDNDGILDINEGLSSSPNAILNGNFGTNGTSGGNITSWTTNGTGTSALTNWAADAGGAVTFLDGAEGINLSQSGVVFKTASTPSFATFSVKVLPVNAGGTSPVNQGWGNIDFYLQTTTGLVRIFRVNNPLTATLASPTSTIELIDSSLVINLAVNGDYSSKSVANGAYSTITVNINTANLPNSGQVLIQRKNGAASGPNGIIGADDFYVDDVSYTYQVVVDTDNDGTPNHLDLDSDGDGCSDALEGGATTNVTANYKFTGPVGANGLDNTLETSDNGVINYTSTYNAYALVNSINACTDTDGDGVRDVIDVDDDNDGILDLTEMVTQSCSSCQITTNNGSLGQFFFWDSDNGNTDPNFGLAKNNLPAWMSQYFTNVQDAPTVSGMTITKSANAISVTGSASTLADAVAQQDYVQWSFTTSCNYVYFDYVNFYNSGGQIRVDVSTSPTFSAGTTSTVYTGASSPNAWVAIQLTTDYLMVPNTTYYIRQYWSGFGSGDYAPGLGFRCPTTLETASLPALDLDTDGDGIPNRLDLDSDGDGCPDAREAGVSANSGASGSMSASGGAIYTGGIPSGTANAYVGNATPSQYGANGFFNGIETSAESGVYNGTYTYQYAIGSNYNMCADTDGDGVVDFMDIDDDNDGVVDAVESPACFYTANEWNTGAKPFYGVTVSSALTTTTANFSQLIDGNGGTTAVAFSAAPAQPILNANVYLFNFAQPVSLSALYMQFNTTTQFAGTTKIQGSNTNNGSDWVDLSIPIAAGTATNTTVNGGVSVTNSIKYPVTLNATTAYKYIRITGAVASNIAAQNASEVYFDFNTTAYVPSQYPKATCINDTDGDGIPNHRDLDSDGDGCPDAREAGVSVNSGASASMSNSGGAIYTGGIPSGTANAYVGNGTPSQYGTNGFFNGIETVADNGIYNASYTYQYAIGDNISACTDTDGDGINDIVDIDDDNDGILDAVESPSCFYTSSEVAVPQSVITQIATTSAIANVYDNDAASVFAFTNAATKVGQTVFEITPSSPLKAASLDIRYSSATSNALGTTASSVNVDGWNGTAWVTLQTYTPSAAVANVQSFGIPGGAQAVYTKYRLQGLLGTVTNASITEVGMTAASDYVPSAHPKLICINDTDGDGIPNHRDLDSDGDGCPDAKEAGVSVNPGAAASMSSSGGSIYTGGIPSGTANAYVGNGTPSQYGANGFFNGIETVADNSLYNGTYTYQYANSNVLNACLDTDGDGVGDLIDIDDDNDGILDTLEQNCPNGSKTGAIVTKPAAINYTFNSTTLANLVDGTDSNTLVMYNPTGTLSNAEWFRVEFPYARVLSSWEVGHFAGQTLFATTSTYKVQGSNDASIWTDLTGTLTYSNTQNGQSTQANNSNIANFSSNQIAYKYYRYYGISGTVGTGWATEFYFRDGSCVDIDTDNDGIPNRLDLDSDGDGCPDAREAGVSVNSGAAASMSVSGGSIYTGGVPSGTANAYVGNGTPSQYGANGFFNGIETNAESGIYNGIYTYQFAIGDNYNMCADTDGDGVIDFMDIDDDNDGVVDAVESPACFYTANEWNTGAKPFYGVTVSSTLTTTTANFSQLIDGNGGTTAVAFSAAPAQPILNANVYLFNFAQPVKLDALYMQFNTTTQFAGTTKIQGSNTNNGSDWVDLSVAVAAGAGNNTTVNGLVSVTNSIKYPVTLNTATAYKYIRITGAVASNIAAQNASEVYFDFNTTGYVASYYPKPTCVNDTDGDGTPNHHDLDSDGDGCSDAQEGGATSNVTANYQFTGAVGANGLDNTLETLENGIVNYTSTYSHYAISSSIKACVDTDGDGVVDVIDIDDDNDGVLDTAEQTCASAYDTTSSSGIDNIFNLYGVTSGLLLNQLADDIGLVFALDSNFTTGIDFSNCPGQGSLYAGNAPIWIKSVNPLNTAQAVPLQSISFKNDCAANAGSPEYLTYEAYGPTGNLLYTYNIAANVTNQNTYNRFDLFMDPAYDVYSIKITRNANLVILIGSSLKDTNGFSKCTEIDTDNDGIPNRLDLDSDGDGCPDTKEAILYNHVTEASIPGTVQNGSGGVVTSTVSTPNAMVPGPYGSNGFADALQSSTNPDAYKYIYTYNFVANNANVSTCDNKFLYDMDSDDDGIPDAVESPTCFYTETQAMNITEGVTSDFTWAAANPLANTYDDNTTYGAVTPAVNIQNKALVTFDLPVIDATFIDYVQLNVGATAFGTGTWRLEGLDMMTNTWVSLSAAQAMSSANTNYSFINTLQPNTRYHTYRILGVTSVNNTDNARLTEFSIHYKNYNPSFHRTKMGCNSDGDNDGVPDYLDRDSDGDGCPDAVEAGIDLSLLGPSNFFNTGGQVAGAHVVVLGNYGDNGMGDLVETTPDSGIVNYVSTYNLYANNPAVNFCLDTDGDGVPDPLDIDDDNDGILDSVESPSCFYTAAEANTVFRINSQFASPDDDQSDRDIQILHDGVATAVFNFNAFTVAENPTGSNLFTVEYNTPVRLATLSVSHAISATAGANAVVVGSYDGYNWSAALSPATLITATPINFVITTSVPYKYYKIQTGSVPGALAVANTIGEISSTLAANYAASAHPKPTCTNDTDGDGVLNHLDLDSDGDGCTDASEAGTVAYALAQTGGQTSAGTVVNTSGITTGVLNAIVGNNTPSDYSANGFYNKIESSDLANATYNGTYTYSNAINALIANCSVLCYKPAIIAGTILDTKQGITSLQRAGSDNDNWPMVRKGAWTALESKTKGFVPNRLTIAQINSIPAANLVEGMMVYNITSDCLYINTDGTATGWKCFNTQTCP